MEHPQAACIPAVHPYRIYSRREGWPQAQIHCLAGAGAWVLHSSPPEQCRRHHLGRMGTHQHRSARPACAKQAGGTQSYHDSVQGIGVRPASPHCCKPLLSARNAFLHALHLQSSMLLSSGAKRACLEACPEGPGLYCQRIIAFSRGMSASLCVWTPQGAGQAAVLFAVSKLEVCLTASLSTSSSSSSAAALTTCAERLCRVGCLWCLQSTALVRRPAQPAQWASRFTHTLWKCRCLAVYSL